MKENELRTRARRVRLLLMDCDGVLTDGRLYFDRHGEALKVFDVKDGQGIALWHAAGFESGIITGRGADEILECRRKELAMSYLQTRSADKVADFEKIRLIAGVERNEVAYIGDDIGDIPLLDIVGFSATTADCASAVLPHIHFVTTANGGRGAVREVVDFLLNSKE